MLRKFLTIGVAALLGAPAEPIPTKSPKTFRDLMVARGFDVVALYHLDSLGWVVPARFDGTRVPLLLDTGGTFTILDRSLVEQIGLPVESSRSQLKGVEGRKADFGTTRFQLVELGPLAFEKPSIGVADLGAVPRPRLGR